MGSATARIIETSFVSTDIFDQRAFKRWVEARPLTDINRYELANGRIVMNPPAGWEHAELEARLSQTIREFVEGNNLGRVFGSSAGYNLPSGDTLEPDISFISHQRWNQGPHVGRGQFLRIVPNLVVEILSPSTARRDRGEKKLIYESNGVDELWLVDPTMREIAVFARNGSRFDSGKRFGARATLRSNQLDGFRRPIRLIFG